MKRIVPVVLAMSVLFLLSSAYGQPRTGAQPRFYSDFKPVVGAWSEYQTKGPDGTPHKMRIAVVGKEGDFYWYEMVTDGGGEGKMIMKSLVAGNPEDPQNVKRAIMKSGNQPAMEMPVQMMRQQSGRAPAPKGNVVVKGMEKVTVPAGTFTAEHIQVQNQDMVVDTWVQKDVAPYGMVKSVSKDHEMVLVAHGMGAQTLITETPRKFEMPQMRQMPQAPRAPIPPGKPGRTTIKPPPADDDDDDEEDDEDADD
jgi:hypothetical protein